MACTTVAARQVNWAWAMVILASRSTPVNGSP